jgi:hypothetical protein
MIIQCLYEMKMLVLLPVLIKNNMFFISIFALSLCDIQTQAQVDKNKKELDFNSFKNRIEADFANFKVQNDSIFLKTLESNWKEYQVFSEERIQRIKPKIQPVAKKGIEKTEIQQPDTPGKIEKIEQPEELPEKEQPPKETEKFAGESISVNFFGEPFQITKPDDLPTLLRPDSKNIISFYEAYLQNQKLMRTTLEIYKTAKELEINDWGYLLLLKHASEKLFIRVNERVLYTWISLLKTGYNARIGYDEQNIFLLTATDGTLFNTRYINISGRNYYIIVFKDQKINDHGLQSYESKNPGTLLPISLKINVLPEFKDRQVNKKICFDNDILSIIMNQTLISFLNDYPGCELDVYFNAPISEKTYSCLDIFLKPRLKGKTNVEKVNILLDFIQKSFPYKTDDEQFGREKYMFGDEAIYFPYTDCDDRAVLMTKLVHRYTGLETVGLDYPNHVSTGVKFNEVIKGDFINYNGEKYFICDPTYIGALAGMGMEEMQKSVPIIIQVKN